MMRGMRVVGSSAIAKIWGGGLDCCEGGGQ